MLARSITLSLSHLATTMGLKAASLGRMRRWASRTANRGILGGVRAARARQRWLHFRSIPPIASWEGKPPSAATSSSTHRCLST